MDFFEFKQNRFEAHACRPARSAMQRNERAMALHTFGCPCARSERNHAQQHARADHRGVSKFLGSVRDLLSTDPICASVSGT